MAAAVTAQMTVPNADGKLSVSADGGLGQFIHNYFNSSMFQGMSMHGQDRENSRTHFILGDQQAALSDLNVVIRNMENMHYLWVNQELMPIRYTTDLQTEFTIVRFDKRATPEETPAESISRMLNISKESFIQRSRRYGLGAKFESDQIGTPQGQKEFVMFVTKISKVFAEHAALLGLSKILMPNAADLYYYNKYGNQSMVSRLNQIMLEVDTTFVGHKNEDGPLEEIYRCTQLMLQMNTDGGPVTHCMFSPEKMPLFKFAMTKLSTKDEVLSGNALQSIQDLKYRPFPSFPADMVEIGREFSMLTRRIEIGNRFIWRNEMLKFAPTDTNIRLQGYINLFDENRDNLATLGVDDLNKYDPRWDADTGFLRSDHEDTKNDLYTYKTIGGRVTACRIIGDMNPDFLPQDYLESVVGVFLKGIDVVQMEEDLVIWASGAMPPVVLKRLRDFMRKARITFGDDKHLLFKTENLLAPLADIAGQHEPAEDRLLRSFMYNLFGAIRGAWLFPWQVAAGAGAVAGAAPPPVPRMFGGIVPPAGLNDGFVDPNAPGADPISGKYRAANERLTFDVATAIDERLEALQVLFGRADLAVRPGMSVDRIAQIGRVNILARGAAGAFQFLDLPTMVQRMGTMRRTLAAYSAPGVFSSNLSNNDFGVIRQGLEVMLDAGHAAAVGNIAACQTAAMLWFKRLEHLVQCFQLAGTDAGYELDDVLIENGFYDANAAAAAAPVVIPAGQIFRAGVHPDPAVNTNVFRLPAAAVAGGAAAIAQVPLRDFSHYMARLNVAGWTAHADWFPAVVADQIMPEGTVNVTHSSDILAPACFGGITSFHVRPETEEDDFDTARRKRARDEMDDTLGDNNNLRHNTARMTGIFASNVEVGVGRLLLLTAIHRDVFSAMLKKNIHIPSEFVIWRPHMTYQTSAVVLFQAQGGVGAVNCGYPNAALGKNVMDKTLYFHVTQWVGPMVPDYRRRMILPYVFYEGRLGGAGSEFFDQRTWSEFIDANWFTSDPNGPSLIPTSIPIGSKVRPTFSDYRGKAFNDETEYHYHSHEVYGKLLAWRDLNGESLSIMERMNNFNPNTLCFQGTQVQVGKVDGSPGLPVENLGHHGMERPGDRFMRERGSTVKRNIAAPFPSSG